MQFFDLPLEIRYLIYRHVFEEAQVHISSNYYFVRGVVPQYDHVMDMKFPGNNRSFLMASKRSYLESISLFYRFCTVTIDKLDDALARKISQLTRFCQLVNTITLHSFRGVALTRLSQLISPKQLTMSGFDVSGSPMNHFDGDTDSVVFDQTNMLEALRNTSQYQSLHIKDKQSALFPKTKILLQFSLECCMFCLGPHETIERWNWPCTFDIDKGSLIAEPPKKHLLF